MFTPEEFKKIFESKILSDEWVLYPESDGGIHYLPKEEENSVYAIYIENGVMTRGIATYRLFLQEVIEGINRKFCYSEKTADKLYNISSILDTLYVKNYNFVEKTYTTDDSFTNDQAKEKTIRYVLEKMEG